MPVWRGGRVWLIASVLKTEGGDEPPARSNRVLSAMWHSSSMVEHPLYWIILSVRVRPATPI